MLPTLRGRGASENPTNRFETIAYERDECLAEDLEVGPATQFFVDQSQSLISYNDSPDVGFNASINPYRGCEHGCIYCYARPTHEYLGLSAGLDFETKIFVKTKAPELLRKELSSKKWRPQVVAISGITDCYQPAERRFRLTRQCLVVFAEFRNPVGIITKNHLVTRDLDILSEMAKNNLAVVHISITTLDPQLAKKLEPRASTPEFRLKTVETLARAGIPTGVLMAPVIPGLTESEIPAILQASARAGARDASYVMLRLPYGVKDLFAHWLEQHYPQRKEKVLHRIQDIRGGKLNVTEYGKRMGGEGAYAQEIAELFQISRRKVGIVGGWPALSTEHFQRAKVSQLNLFP